MKGTTYRLNFRPITDFTGITANLERMAAKGWMLDRIGPILWRFRRIEPRSTHFSVTYLSISSTLLDPVDTPETQALEEFCAGTGWYRVTGFDQMQIFANNDPDPLPLETDPVAQVQNIHRTMKQRVLPGNIATAVIAGLLAVLAFAATGWDRIFSDKGSLMLLGFTALVLGGLTAADLLTYFFWHRRAAAAAEAGVLIPSVSYPIFPIAVLAILLASLVGWLSSTDVESALRFLLLFGSIWLVRIIVDRMRRNPNSRAAMHLVIWPLIFILAFGQQFVIRAVTDNLEPDWLHDEVQIEVDGKTYVLFQDDIPLRTEDLMEVNTEHQSYQRYEDGAFPYQFTRGMQQQLYSGEDFPSLCYAIYDFFPLLYDIALRDALDYSYFPENGAVRSHLELDPGPWEADAVYQLCLDGAPQPIYIICWDSRIVTIYPFLGSEEASLALTQDQIDTIVEKLKPN